MSASLASLRFALCLRFSSRPDKFRACAASRGPKSAEGEGGSVRRHLRLLDLTQPCPSSVRDRLHQFRNGSAIAFPIPFRDRRLQCAPGCRRIPARHLGRTLRRCHRDSSARFRCHQVDRPALDSCAAVFLKVAVQLLTGHFWLRDAPSALLDESSRYAGRPGCSGFAPSRSSPLRGDCCAVLHIPFACALRALGHLSLNRRVSHKLHKPSR